MFLLEVDQNYLQLESKEEVEIITNLLYVVTGYPTGKDDSIYNYPLGDDDVELKRLCEIYSGDSVDTVLIRYIPELLHCLTLVVLFLEPYHEEPYANYLQRRIQSLLKEIQQHIQKRTHNKQR